MFKIFFALLANIFCVSISMAQYHTVSGSVYAWNDLALKNIKVMAKKSGAKVNTDSTGSFVIAVADKDKLRFEGAGFTTIVKSVKNDDNIRLKMVFRGGPKNEEIAIGFGHVSREKINYAISHYAVYNNDYCNYVDIFDLLQGKFSGVQVVSNGGTNKHVLVRGVSSNSSSIYAIYVVDGTILDDISHIQPSRIKNISVIKDGNAYYGMRGANGVVEITTIDGF